MIDLGSWASDEYKIESRLEDETGQEPSEKGDT